MTRGTHAPSFRDTARMASAAVSRSISPVTTAADPVRAVSKPYRTSPGHGTGGIVRKTKTMTTKTMRCRRRGRHGLEGASTHDVTP